MKNETDQHRTLKELLTKKLEEWFGAAIMEYHSSGHELDVFSVSTQGVSAMIEIIWTPSTTNFYKDMMILLQSDAQVKILIVNRLILEKPELVRAYRKARIKEMQRGTMVSDMIDGSKLLQDEIYLNEDVKNHILRLVNDSKLSTEVEVDELKRRIFTDEPLSGIISECLNIARLRNFSETEKWLNNELYGYPTDSFHDENELIGLAVSKLPNNPDYRIIRPKLRFLFGTRYEEVDYPLFWGHPISEIERVGNVVKEGQGQALIHLPLDSFPPGAVSFILKAHPDTKSMPATITGLDIARCFDALRLKIHKFLESS